MANQQTFDVLRHEFRRAGVDPDTFSAVLAQRPEDALRALQALPDNAGPSAFLAQLRSLGFSAAATTAAQESPTLDERRRDKSA